jgi:hypothetical protein
LEKKRVVASTINTSRETDPNAITERTTYMFVSCDENKEKL